jgi:hypothetical protein
LTRSHNVNDNISAQRPSTASTANVSRFPRCPCSFVWPTTMSSANSSGSSIPRAVTRCGSQVPASYITIVLWKWATLVTYAEANSTVFSTPYFLRTIHPIARSGYRSTMSLLTPTYLNTSTLAWSSPIITFRPESATRQRSLRSTPQRECGTF